MGDRFRPRPDDNVFFFLKRTRIASFWPTVHTDPENATLFENGSQGGEIRKHSPPVLMWTAIPHTFQNDDAIAPPRDVP